MNPSDFRKVDPMSSVFRTSEDETIARNIMVILYRNGDVWRELPWDEYAEERQKDGRFSEWREKPRFERVLPYTTSEDQARLFSPDWASV